MKRTSYEFVNNVAGQKKKIATIDKMESQGWKLDREEIVPSSFSPCMGFILLIICFPLVLFGYNKGKVIVSFTKE